MKKFLITICIVIALGANVFAQSGFLDLTFNIGTGANNIVTTTSIQTDGKIIIGGSFTSYNGTARNYIARLNADGTLDPTFNPGLGSNLPVETSSVQSDGKIIIGGGFTSYNGTARNRIARLNTDGTLDATFNPGTGPDAIVWDIFIQTDEKIIIAGHFSNYNGVNKGRIARLNSDGAIDTTFNLGSGANSTIYSIALQNDGQIIIGGDFNTFSTTPINRIARLNTNGTLDSTFNSAPGPNNTVYTNSIQNDGKIIIGGTFTSCNGTARNYIARLNNDGTLDTTFNPGIGTSSAVSTSLIQPDGKILIGGAFSSYNGTSRNSIVRINTDGTLDVTFNPGTGADNKIDAIGIQNDGQLIINGAFSAYNGSSRKRIARLLNDVTVGLENHNAVAASIKLFPNPTEGMLTLQGDDLSGAVVNTYSSIGQLLMQQKVVGGSTHIIDLSTKMAGLYIVEVNQENNVSRFKVAKE